MANEFLKEACLLSLHRLFFRQKHPPSNDTLLTIEDVCLTFMIWAGGLLMAFVALMIEFRMPNNKWIAPNGGKSLKLHSDAKGRTKDQSRALIHLMHDKAKQAWPRDISSQMIIACNL